MRDIMPCKDCKYKHNEHDTHEYGYGMCVSCTPKKLNETLEAIHDRRIDAGREWDVKMADKKKAYINKKAASLEKKALRIYNSKRPAGYEEITDVSKL